MAAGKKKPEDKNTGTTGSERLLRDDAEAQLASLPKHSRVLKGQTPEQLIHELQVHQIELETQAEELKKSKLTLEESRDKFLDLFDFAPTGILTLSEKSLILEVNLTGSTLLGVERSKLVSTRFSTFVAFEDQDQWHFYIKNLLQKEGKQGCTLLLKRTGGSAFPARLEGVRLGSGGIYTEARIAFSDITDMKTAEEALRETTTYLENLIDYANAPIVTWDPEFRITRFNHAFERMTGRNQKEVFGKKLDFLFPVETSKASLALIHNLHKDKRLVTIEIPILTKDGSVRTVLWNSANIAKPDGRIISTIAQGVDITERKKMESEIQSLNRDLEKRVIERTNQLNASLEDKTVLLQEVHHRVRNTFQIIISLLSLQLQYIDAEETKQVFKESQNRIHAMGLVHEKLHSSTDIATIDLDNYFRLLGNKLLQFYGVRGRDVILNTRILDIHTDVNTAIPIGLIINELISNSLKHAFPEGRRGEISIAVQRENAILTIVFKDNGIGIPADQDWRNIKALGLQLVIVLVGQLDGTIELDRTVGTTFTIVVKEMN